MDFRPPFRFETPPATSAEFGREMMGDVDNETLNVSGAGFRTGSVTHPYHRPSRFAANHVTPIQIDLNIEQDGPNRTLQSQEEGSALSADVVNVQTTVAPSIPSDTRAGTRPGRGGRLQCPPCRKQKRGKEVVFNFFNRS